MSASRKDSWDRGLLRPKEAAAWLGVSLRTLYREVASGKLPRPVKVGACSRFPQTELERYVEQLKRERSG